MSDQSRNSIASSIAGFIGQTSTMLLFPLETIKFHLMVSDGFSANKIPKYNSPMQALAYIYNRNGIYGLYQGCYTTFFSSIAWMAYFYCYENFKSLHKVGLDGQHSEFFKLLVAYEASIVARLISNPIWVIKTRVILNLNSVNWYSDIGDAVSKIYKIDGIRGFYSGLVPGLILCYNGAIQIYTYELLKQVLQSQDSNLLTSIAGGGSKLLSGTLLYPIQTVMTRLMQEQNPDYIDHKSSELQKKLSNKKFFRGVLDCVKSSYQHGGIQGFYRGLSMQLMRLVPANALFFTVYENTYRLLTN